MSENISKANENDYTPVNKYIDEQSRLRRAKSFRMNAISWALLLIAIGLLAVLLAWAYSLLDRNYVLKRVAGVQEQVIQEKINEAISSSGISDSVEDLKMLGNNQMAIDKLNEAEDALKDEKDKNQSLSKKNQALSDQKKKHKKEMLNAANELKLKVGELKTFESEKLALLKKLEDTENQLSELKEDSEERDKLLKQLEDLEKENENIKNDFYLFSEERIKVKNNEVRVMTRFLYKGLDISKPINVTCYVDFSPSFGVKLADLELGSKDDDFRFDDIFIKKGFTKLEFEKIKKENCRFLN